MSHELPKGWVRAQLHDVLEQGGLFDGPFGSSLKTDDYTDSGVRVIRLENLANLRFVEDRETYISETKYKTLTKHTVFPGDILVGSFVDGAVRVCLLPELPTKAIAKADCFTVRTCTDVADRRFVAFQLGSSAIRDSFIEDIHGATRPRITTNQLRNCELAFAPLSEQHRVVEKIEALLADVSRATARLDRVPLILRKFRRAVLEAACAGKLTDSGIDDGELPSGWRLAPVGDLVVPGGIFDGARDHGSRTPVVLNLRTADYTDSGVRVIRLENLGHLTFVDSKKTYISEAKYAGLKQNTINEGDILFGSFIGDSVRVCLFPKLETPAITKADCFCVRVRPEAVLRDYLVLQLATKRTHDSLLEEVHGATRPRITTKQLRAISMPLCSPEEQGRIVLIVRRFFALADMIKRRVQTASARAEKLPEAILSKAFAGELVPTEAELARAEAREYESAAALLARVARKCEPPSMQRKSSRKRKREEQAEK